MKWPLLARAGAIAIAAAALVDPSLSATRTVPARLGILAPSDAKFPEGARGALEGYTVLDGAAPDAQALVVVARDGVPLPRVPDGRPVFVMRDARAGGTPRIEQLVAPASARLGGAVPITARVRRGTSGAPIIASLFAGERLAAREEIATADATADVRLVFAPATAGLIPLRLHVQQGGASAAAVSAVLVTDTRARIWFDDAKPSWSSTFVRRALEGDAAFDVAATIAASRGLSTTIGPALDLGDAAAQERMDVLVLGSASAASAATFARVERFARVRGGSVVVLADSESGPALARLTGITSWTRRVLAAPAVASGGHGALRVSEALIAGAPPTAVVLASLAGGGVIVQDVPLGAGRVIVSGALDAWRYRSADGEAFARFWRAVIGDAASSAAPPLRVTPDRTAVAPGESFTIEAALRGATTAGAVEVHGAIEGAAGASPIRLWPSALRGVFHASVTAPANPGEYVVRVKATLAGGATPIDAQTVVLVTAAPPPGHAHSAAALTALAASHGGSVVANESELRSALDAAFGAHAAAVDVHPMRSAWWLVPFVLGLGLEWKWRRERGLR